LTVICHVKRAEQNLLRQLVERASKYEAIWAVKIILDFLNSQEIDLIQVSNQKVRAKIIRR